MAEHYSIERLEVIADGDKDFLKVLAETFLDEIPDDFENMLNAIENENRKLAYQFAHKIKPNLEMFGAELEKDMTAIESWSKTTKNKSFISENLENTTTRVYAMIKELKKDFEL